MCPLRTENAGRTGRYKNRPPAGVGFCSAARFEAAELLFRVRVLRVSRRYLGITV